MIYPYSACLCRQPLSLAAFRWLRVSPAKAAEKFEVEKPT